MPHSTAEQLEGRRIPTKRRTTTALLRPFFSFSLGGGEMTKLSSFSGDKQVIPFSAILYASGDGLGVTLVGKTSLALAGSCERLKRGFYGFASTLSKACNMTFWPSRSPNLPNSYCPTLYVEKERPAVRMEHVPSKARKMAPRAIQYVAFSSAEN